MSEHIFGYVYEERKPPRLSFSKRKLSISDEDANEFEISETAVFGADVVSSLTARIKELEQALAPLVDEFGCSLDIYDRIGPDWTHSDGTQTLDVSVLVNRRELIESARAALNKDKTNG